MDDLGQHIRAATEAAGLPPPTTLADDIERVLLVMLAAHDHLGIDSLTPHEISIALRDGFRLDVPRQRVQSLLDSNRDLALSRKARGKRKYQILDAGERRVKTAGTTDVLFIQPENALTRVREVQDLMATRSGVVYFCDPYLAPRSLDFLVTLTSASELRVLTQQVNKESAVKRDLKPLALQLGVPVEIRRVGSRVLHDRYLIDDNEMFILGTSLNGLGLKQSMVVKVGLDLRATALSEFVALWGSAVAI